MEDLSLETLERIASAHIVNGAPPEDATNGYRNIGDLLLQQTERFEVKPFLVFYGEGAQRRELSYREFYEETCRTAMFLSSIGVKRGDRIATISFNHSDVVLQYFASWLLGASVVPLNPGEDDRHLAYILQHSGATVLLVRDIYLERMEHILQGTPEVRRVILVGSKASSKYAHLETEVLRHPSAIRSIPPVSITDEALVIYTSGTTGNPKGVILSHRNLLADAQAIAEWHQVSESETMMCVLPLHHVNGIVVTVITPLYGGSTIVLNQKFHPDRFFERISAERVAIVSVVPTILQFLLHAKLDMAAYKMASFRHLICGAGPLTVELAAKFEHTFKIPIIHGYGLSETTCYSCFLPIDLDPATHRAWMMKHGFPSIGLPLPINEMAIFDGEGNALDEGQRGEIVIRGHNVMERYLKNPEVNDETFRDGWFRSGDEGFFLYDEEGRKFFFITGRIKELIIRGGVNISPFEIDEVLMRVPGISAAIAVGFDNDWYGEEVGAMVIPKSDAQVSIEQILAFCRKHLPFTKAPKVVVFAQELPVTSTGKYQRSRCKEQFAQWKSVQFVEPLPS
ncbi:MAG: class I adenylate-forming enzyme family protein [Bacteroidota bacterium]